VPRDDHVIVLFGATGDLARRMLLPGLFRLARAGLLPARYRIIGSARSALTDDEFRQHARSAVAEFGKTEPPAVPPGRTAARLRVHDRHAR
jgi:glucose-6-phosphate 1-dehydrogenase